MLFRRHVTLRDLRDANGVSHRAVDLRRGRLAIFGHDVGGQYDEYEFERRLSREETSRLAELLGVRRAGLLDEIERRFADTPPLEDFLREHGLPGKFWNRIG